jgi:hypothetical protein
MEGQHKDSRGQEQREANDSNCSPKEGERDLTLQSHVWSFRILNLHTRGINNYMQA